MRLDYQQVYLRLSTSRLILLTWNSTSVLARINTKTRKRGCHIRIEIKHTRMEDIIEDTGHSSKCEQENRLERPLQRLLITK